jgi:hypothetical protein
VTAPAPTNVLQKINDRLVAPRASASELLVTYTAALAGSALAIALASLRRMGAPAARCGVRAPAQCVRPAPPPRP